MRYDIWLHSRALAIGLRLPLACSAIARQVTGQFSGRRRAAGPGPVQVVATQQAGDVEQFAHHKQIFAHTAAHGFGVYFVGIHTAGAGLCLFKPRRGAWYDPVLLHGFNNGKPRRTRKLSRLAPRAFLRQQGVHKALGQVSGQQGTRRLFASLRGIKQGGHIKRRQKIQGQGRTLVPVKRSLERCRAAEAIVGKEQVVLPLVLPQADGNWQADAREVQQG